MGNLNPGGQRTNANGRIFGAKAIERACQHKEYDSDGSIAGKPHANSREIARRQRQAERKAARNG